MIPSLTEASHKVLRFASKHLARQNDNEKNAYDCFMHLWFVSDPLVRAEFEVDSDSDSQNVEKDGDDHLVESFFIDE